MNKKQKTYSLLIVVLVVWGLIGYNIYRYLYPIQERQSVATPKRNTTLIEPVAKDTLIISNYRDPFLGKVFVTNFNGKKAASTSIKFPSIIYHGLVEGSRVKSYIISIENQQELLKLGQMFLDVKLISANAKVITISFKGARKTIKLAE
ncbi:hypothetical protein [Winogradskyella sp.]|uniref:hypothetical protein n=1 Tax=Winogradskyella sp. TaxID=1883156 RepID=UPI003AB26A04